MNCQEKLNDILKVYKRVSLLSDKNGCKVLRIRHKEFNTDLILHILSQPNYTYELLCNIKAQNLPFIYDIFYLEDGVIVLEEYIDGLNLAQICETGKMTRRGAFKILQEVCNGLLVLHENQIVHRDVKPENVMVDKTGRVVLIDFNSSRKIAAKSQDTVIMGTVGYASPEQMGIKQSDTRSDIYAMGILLNVLLTGHHPSEKTLKGHAGHIVKKCTAISPDNRYQTVKEFKRALRLF